MPRVKPPANPLDTLLQRALDKPDSPAKRWLVAILRDGESASGAIATNHKDTSAGR